ncbi:phosphoserine phosphatase SerB [Formicincola oecophyllae]|uniref:Phosphoserine phosphatase n=1 Tax=Formicincola oecophyllae TaxID=2558361 RepID=A0A4Y6U879_9PROT|nr:phosphoserine phosphatase SerB [Formicincola oecophyllae]QDH13562.1 phosphoserine phosphatase SerB [Formicincola oecophyllae]
MSLPSILTLVANRRDNTLSKEAIELGRDIVKGAAPVTLSEGEAVEIPFTTKDRVAAVEAARKALGTEQYRVDTIVTGTEWRRKMVLISDMDSTTVDGETMDDLAKLNGTGEKCAEITHEAMNGKMDFAQSIRARAMLLRGLTVQDLEKTLQGFKLADDIEELVRTMNANHALTALVSGGFTWFTSRIAKVVGFDFNYGNFLEIKDGVVTGKLLGPILGPLQKREHLIDLCKRRGVTIKDSITTGDGANDIPMLTAAGLGVAYHAKPSVRKKVHEQVNFCGMRALLFAQGYHASQIIK